MTSSPTVEAARHFLHLVWNGDPPTDEALSHALDRLVLAYYDTPDVGGSISELEAPRQDGASIYSGIATRFPDYGLYPVAEPLEPIDQQMGMADAIDDLADLTNDMREVVWFAENVGIDDAHWSFRLHYFHWGEHARRLSFYLFARQS